MIRENPEFPNFEDNDGAAAMFIKTVLTAWEDRQSFEALATCVFYAAGGSEPDDTDHYQVTEGGHLVRLEGRPMSKVDPDELSKANSMRQQR